MAWIPPPEKAFFATASRRSRLGFVVITLVVVVLQSEGQKAGNGVAKKKSSQKPVRPLSSEVRYATATA